MPQALGGLQRFVEDWLRVGKPAHLIQGAALLAENGRQIESGFLDLAKRLHGVRMRIRRLAELSLIFEEHAQAIRLERRPTEVAGLASQIERAEVVLRRAVVVASVGR